MQLHSLARLYMLTTEELGSILSQPNLFVADIYTHRSSSKVGHMQRARQATGFNTAYPVGQRLQSSCMIIITCSFPYLVHSEILSVTCHLSYTSAQYALMSNLQTEYKIQPEKVRGYYSNIHTCTHTISQIMPPKPVVAQNDILKNLIKF